MKRSQARSKESLDFAKSQRASSNEFSSTAWQWLRNRQICGQKFRREVPIPPYTVDFCCVELKRVIEIDGESHFNAQGLRRDRERDAFLASLGFQVLRIEGNDVVRDGAAVIERMRSFVSAAMDVNPSPPAPLPAAGRGERKY